MVPDRLRPRNNPDRTSATGALNSAVTEIATDEPPVRPSHSSLGRSMSAAALAYGSGSGPEWSWCLASPHGAWLGAWPDYSKLGGWRFTASRTRTRAGGISTFLCTRIGGLVQSQIAPCHAPNTSERCHAPNNTPERCRGVVWCHSLVRRFAKHLPRVIVHDDQPLAVCDDPRRTTRIPATGRALHERRAL
jgi:hypothetical protein